MRTCVQIMAYPCKAAPLQRVLDPGRPDTEAPNYTQKQFQFIVIINEGHGRSMRNKTGISTLSRTYITKPHSLKARRSGPHQRALTNYERAACSLSDGPEAGGPPFLPGIKLTPLSQLFPFPRLPSCAFVWPVPLVAYWANFATATANSQSIIKDSLTFSGSGCW